MINELAELRQRISELETSESECKQAEEKYCSLVSNIPDVIWTSDEGYGIVYVSPNVERLTGLHPRRKNIGSATG